MSFPFPSAETAFADGGAFADAIEAKAEALYLAIVEDDDAAFATAKAHFCTRIAQLVTIDYTSGTGHTAAMDDLVAALRQLAITHHPVPPE